LLSFAIVYFSESGLFNELRPIQLKFSQAFNRFRIVECGAIAPRPDFRTRTIVELGDEASSEDGMKCFSFKQEIVGDCVSVGDLICTPRPPQSWPGLSRPSTQPRRQTDEKERRLVVDERCSEKSTFTAILPPLRMSARPEDVPKVLRGDVSRGISGFDCEWSFEQRIVEPAPRRWPEQARP
jgi:hypothetical protein